MKVSRSALLSYNAAQMFDVIADVRSYPDFINWCKGMEVLEESVEEVVATLIVSFGKLNFSFTTRNHMQRSDSVTMQLVDGPFSNLEGQWTILALDENACKVSLDMDFAFDNPITQKLFGRIFQKVVSAQLDAFQERANQLYGGNYGYN